MSNYQGPGRYRHYKGGLYAVLGLALQENTVTKHEPDGTLSQIGEGHEEMTFVIYMPLTPGSMLEDRREMFWARELADFDAQLPQGPRFAWVGVHE